MRYSVGLGPFRFYGGGRRRKRPAPPPPKPGSVQDIVTFFVGLAVVAIFPAVLFQSFWVWLGLFVGIGVLVMLFHPATRRR
ncbi:MAG TPA: hypothetical protein VHC18_18340 [Amycolatopsis sp.]|jgi:hypothetical protein|nr:hypothetical protein [Amycolatopsis sp.]